MLTFVIIYLVIGLFAGLSNISKGIQGSGGPVATIIGHMILWPFFIIYK